MNALTHLFVERGLVTRLPGHLFEDAFEHVGRPNAKGCAFPPSNCSMSANSAHANGLNVLLCDGSVRFLTESMRNCTFAFMVTKAKGEVVNE